MKKIIVTLLLLACAAMNAQDFVYDKAYFECENKWVAMPQNVADSTYTAAFLYLDREAGFSLRLQGNLRKEKNGRWRYTALDRKSATIYRIPQDFAKLALIPPDIIAAAGMAEIPDWVWDYREGEEDAAQLIQRGYHYNHAGASKFAIPLLLKAYSQEPDAGQLAFELGYAYNATHQFAEAERVLAKALKKMPQDPMLLRELGYAYAQLLKTDDAEKVYRTGISFSKVPDQQAEMAFNMMGAYFRAGNKKKFVEWSDIMKKYAEPGSIFLKYYLQMEKELDRK